MNIQLIQGQFNAEDALDIITRMIDIKVKYHENKITGASTEEDIKFRETKIRRLQDALADFRKSISEKSGNITIDTIIKAAI